MVENSIDQEPSSVYRGGSTLIARPHDVKIDRVTGLLRKTHGVSVDSDANEVARFGGAFRVGALPQGLKLIQRGQRKSHYEIVPAHPMLFDEYQDLLAEIDLSPAL